MFESNKVRHEILHIRQANSWIRNIHLFQSSLLIFARLFRRTSQIIEEFIYLVLKMKKRKNKTVLLIFQRFIFLFVYIFITFINISNHVLFVWNFCRVQMFYSAPRRRDTQYAYIYKRVGIFYKDWKQTIYRVLLTIFCNKSMTFYVIDFIGLILNMLPFLLEFSFTCLSVWERAPADASTLWSSSQHRILYSILMNMFCWWAKTTVNR